MDARGFVTPTAPLTETPLEPWRAVLLDAADYIEAHGWTAQTGRDRDGRVCAWIAIDSPTRLDKFPMTPEQRKRRAAGEFAEEQFAAFVGVPGPSSIPIWNDTPGRTAAEVTAALRECANQGV